MILHVSGVFAGSRDIHSADQSHASFLSILVAFDFFKLIGVTIMMLGAEDPGK